MKQINEYSITDLSSLNKQIDALYIRKEELEKTLDDNWTFLQKNYVHLIRNNVLERMSFLQKNSLLNNILSIPKVKDAVASITEKVITTMERLLLKLVHKVTE